MRNALERSAKLTPGWSVSSRSARCFGVSSASHPSGGPRARVCPRPGGRRPPRAIAPADRPLSDAEPDCDHRCEAVGEPRSTPSARTEQVLSQRQATEPLDPTGHKAAASEIGPRDHNGSPAGSVAVGVETAASTGWISTSGAGCGPDEVDVGQVREHDGVELDTSHTPFRVEGSVAF